MKWCWTINQKTVVASKEMSITWIAAEQRKPSPDNRRILALDRRTGFVSVVWFEEIDEFGNWEWRINGGGGVSEAFVFTHWAPITLPM